MTQAEDYHFEDFTEASYRRMLQVARERYAFVPFGTETDVPHVLWRHDVDFSVHRALRMAEMEAELELSATYFLLLHSPFYSLLEATVRDLALEIRDLGHHIGLHFDAGYYGGVTSRADLEQQLGFERDILGSTLGAEIGALAFHVPAVTGTEEIDDDVIGGMVNAGGRDLRERYAYVSDSNGYWRHRRLPEVLESGQDDRLHVLTHPGWWQPTAMSPRERLRRCVQGRALHSEAWYDDFIAAWGRENVR